MKMLLSTAAALALTASTLTLAQAQSRLGALDTNADGMISEAEYDAGRGTFNENGFRGYDVDNDGVITSDEYATGSFRFADADGDGQLNADEQKASDDADMRWDGVLKRMVKTD